MPYNYRMKKSTHRIPAASRSRSRERFRRAYWQALHHLELLRIKQWEQSRLTIPQVRVLLQIRRHPNITTGTLARTLGVTVSTTSGLVSKLVERDLVCRCFSENDRRQIPLKLTEAGQDLAGELLESSRPFLDGVAHELGDDLEEVTAALEALTQAASRVRDSEVLD
jgi:DNA-binding MarR family transcriptional regulator